MHGPRGRLTTAIVVTATVKVIVVAVVIIPASSARAHAPRYRGEMETEACGRRGSGAGW